MESVEHRLEHVEEELSKLWTEYMKIVLTFPEESLDKHKDQHHEISEQERLRKVVDEENAAAVRSALRDLAIFLIKCALIAVATGTGLYTVIGSQMGAIVDVPHAVVEKFK